MALGFVGYTRSLSRKRIAISNTVEEASLNSSSISPPLKRICSGTFTVNSDKSSRFEALPQDILVRVICKVDHEDLNQLYQVSKTIKEAALVAQQWHFQFSTPKKKTVVFFNDEVDEFPEIETPKAPIKPISMLRREKLADLSVALFAAMDEEN